MYSDKLLVELKSHNSKYILNIYTNDYHEAMEHIKNKFGNEDILRGIEINYINAESLDDRHIEMIKEYLKDEFDIEYREIKPAKKQRMVQKNVKIDAVNLSDDTKLKLSKNDVSTTNKVVDEDYRTKIIRHSLRSGSCVNYDGNILVMGDVNAGAELIASGNIIVLGVLRGFAKAGVNGDRDAMVLAYKIVATQLRIAECIAVPPKDDRKDAVGMQMAIIKDDEIEIQQIN